VIVYIFYYRRRYLVVPAVTSASSGVPLVDGVHVPVENSTGHRSTVSEALVPVGNSTGHRSTVPEVPVTFGNGAGIRATAHEVQEVSTGLADVSIKPMADSFNLKSSVDNLLERIASSQLSRPMPVVDTVGKVWRKDSFCGKFLLDTLSREVPVCSNKVSQSDSIICYGSDIDPATMGSCVLRNIAVQPNLLYKSIEAKSNFDNGKTIFLINNGNTSCIAPNNEFFARKVEKDDFQLKLLSKIAVSKQRPSSVCDVWINKTAFFFVSEKFHIYFRFLAYYNVHKALWDHQVSAGDYLIVRISTNDMMLYPEFDDALFPGTINLKHLPNATVCFKKVVTVPRCFSSTQFRCKMSPSFRKECFQCSGANYPGMPFHSFRERTLRACNVTGNYRSSNSSLIVISRKPYVRYPGDKLKQFQRVLANEDQLVNVLRNSFPGKEVRAVHLEQLPICEQIRLAYNADVLMGVHGAGLVHFWWLKDNALAYEMEPSFEIGNPSFRMLTTLTGRKYHSFRTGGTMMSVTVDINRIVQEIRDHIYH